MPMEALKVVAVTARTRHLARVQLLRIHGTKSVLVGFLIFFTGGLPYLTGTLSTVSRTGLGVMAMVAGTFLLLAVAVQDGTRGKLWTEVTALWFIGLWDLCVAGFLLAGILLYEGPWTFGFPWEPLPATQPRLFGVVIYLALLAMVWGVHVNITMDVLARPPSQRDDAAALDQLVAEVTELAERQVLVGEYAEALEKWAYDYAVAVSAGITPPAPLTNPFKKSP